MRFLVAFNTYTMVAGKELMMLRKWEAEARESNSRKTRPAGDAGDVGVRIRFWACRWARLKYFMSMGSGEVLVFSERMP